MSYRVRALLVVAALAIRATSSQAHQPHDEVMVMALSPAFGQDGTAFVLARRPPPPAPALPLMTTDGGLTWKRLTRGLDHRGEFTSICVSPNFAVDSTVFLAEAPFGDPRPDSHGVYASVDGGLSWARISDGMPSLTPGIVACATDAQSNPIVVVAGRFGGAARSTDLGATWTQLVPNSTTVTALDVSPSVQQDGVILAGSKTGVVYRSTNYGASWSIVASLPGAGTIHEIQTTSGGAVVFAGTDAVGLQRSLDGGVTFTPANSGLPSEPITALDLSPNFPYDHRVYVATATEGVFSSTNAGDTWTQLQEGLLLSGDASVMTDFRYQDLDVSPDFTNDRKVFVSMFEGLFRSTNKGGKWLQLDPIPQSLVTNVSFSTNYLNDSTLALLRYGGGIAISFDDATSWTQANLGLDNPYLYDIAFTPSYETDQTLFAVGLRYKSTKSSDRAASWSLNGLDDLYQGTRVAISEGFASDQTVFLGTRRQGVYRTTDGGDSWTQVFYDAPARVDSLRLSPQFATDGTAFVGRRILGALKSTDGGDTWQSVNAGLPLDSARGPLLRPSPDYFVDARLFAGTLQGLFESTDGAATWSLVAITGLPSDVPIEELALSPTFGTDGTMIVSTRGHGLFKSIDGGTSWSEIAVDLSADNELFERIRFSPAFSSDGVIVGFSSSRLYRSNDGGQSWALMNQGWIRQENNRPFDQALLYAGSGVGVPSASASAGHVTWMQTSGSRATFYFYGKGVRFVGARADFLGKADIYVDGALQAEVDEYSPTMEMGAVLFEVSDLTVGPHRLEIVLSGQKNASSSGIGVYIDAIDWLR